MAEDNERRRPRRTEGIQATEEKEKKTKKPLSIVRPTVPTELTETLSQRLSSTKAGSRYDCMVCLAGVGREDDIWECRSCWAMFHIDCIQKWSSSASQSPSVNEEVEEISQQLRHSPDPISAALIRHRDQQLRLSQQQQQQQQSPKVIAWRCPGCRSVQTELPVPSCFCGKVLHPQKRSGFNEPHSCGAQCGRRREGTNCPHACTLVCHPGPCPPCPAMGSPRYCYCGKKMYKLRCGEEDGGSSCGAICMKLLSCGKHHCKKVCHSGPCESCAETIVRTCHCGLHTEPRPCGPEEHFSCGGKCPKTLACGSHSCPLMCHSGSCPSCDLLPEALVMCPCGKTRLSDLLKKPRKQCTDPVPTCTKFCEKPLPGCDHLCQEFCHHGPCPPCRTQVEVLCRCRSTTRMMLCSEKTQAGVILCNKICNAKKNCRKHTCGERCCPALLKTGDPEGWHLCKLICGQKLNCGKHTCEMLCHPGQCSACGRLDLEPLSCRCGQTVIAPPVPCGSAPPECMKPCRIPRPCGHTEIPTFQHRCHFGDCPPCVVLVDRMCSGGHELWHNIPCHRLVVSCGRPCGRPLPCGQHTCRTICHPGPCPVNPDAQQKGCGLPCGKKRQGCGHGCKEFCHPGSECPLSPCTEKITVKCGCGRRSLQVECLSVGDATDKPRELECDDECILFQRRRVLAQAFGIRPEGKEAPAYGDFLLQFAAGRKEFVRSVERLFAQFLNSDARSIPMKSMDSPSRQFVQALAKFYGLLAVTEGQDPSKYVLITKTVDSSLPNVPISTVAADIIPRASSSSSSSSSYAINPTATHNKDKDKDGEESFVLKLSDSVSLDGAQIQQVLSQFSGQCQLVWLDRRNALAVFRNDSALRSAKAQLLPLGIVEGGI